MFGVPRSGTTLLRTLLDSHPSIACGPETPWLGGHQPRSVMELVRFLTEDKHGYCASYGRPREAVIGAARGFVSELMEGYARSKGKERWAEKTPDNVLYVDFLLELFPEAKVLWLVRDGLDVALSTSVVSEERKGISKFLEESLSFGPGVPAVAITPFNALLRWRHWNKLLARSLRGREHLKISYERLVSEPGATVEQVCEFVGEPFEPGMLEYAKTQHDYPVWEWGSADVRMHGGIRKDRAGRARRELTPQQRGLLMPLLSGAARERTAKQPLEQNGTQVRAALGSLASALKVGEATTSLSDEDLAWLWSEGLTHMRLDNARLFDLSGELTVLPWIAAMAGARASVRACDARSIKSLRTLAQRLRVDLDVSNAEPRTLKAPDAKADVITALCPRAAESWTGATLAGQARRVLKEGGVLLAAGPFTAELCAATGFNHTKSPSGNVAVLTAR